MSGRDTDESTVDTLPTMVFLDTSVLLNFIQRGIERDVSSSLFEETPPKLVVGVTVKEEIEAVSARRADIYPDFLDFLLAEEGRIEEYDPTDRRPYFQGNDRTHIENIQMQLADLDSRAEMQRRLRRFVRAVERRIEYLRTEVIPDALFEHQPGLGLMFALQDVIANDADRRVIGDAALWAAEGDDSSGVFLTIDETDLLAVETEINETLRNQKGTSWELRILHPSVLKGLHSATTRSD